MGGGWINMGLPMYVSIERKPEDGGEIQNINDGKTGIMMQLKIDKTKIEEDRLTPTSMKTLNKGTQVLLELLFPFRRYKNRIVCADSYFALVQTALKLYELGFRFIGVVKTATIGYPLSYMKRLQMEHRGDSYYMLRPGVTNTEPTLMSCVWMDRDRPYFTSSCGHMDYEEPNVRTCWRQVQPVETNAEPERLTITTGQPNVTASYYTTCGRIDQHNRCRQDDLMLERKVHVWCSRRVATLQSQYQHMSDSKGVLYLVSGGLDRQPVLSGE